MVNGNGNGRNGHWTLVLPVGALTLLGALFLTVAKDATVALQLAAADKEEMVILHGEIQALTSQLSAVRAVRYTARDAERDFRFIQRDVDACNLFIKEHRKVGHD